MVVVSAKRGGELWTVRGGDWTNEWDWEWRGYDADLGLSEEDEPMIVGVGAGEEYNTCF